MPIFEIKKKCTITVSFNGRSDIVFSGNISVRIFKSYIEIFDWTRNMSMSVESAQVTKIICSDFLQREQIFPLKH